MSGSPVLSVVVPVFNEVAMLPSFHASLQQVLKQIKQSYEIIYCDDGSVDGSVAWLQACAAKDSHVKLIAFSRNFGKEAATTAGIRAARGKAILTIDADGQHPVEMIPEFIQLWERGAQVVVGVRASNQEEGFVKRAGSKLHNALMTRLARVDVQSGATDFRLIDTVVQQQFAVLTERNRITRGLIDWLGFRRETITFHARARAHGEASYSLPKLLKLAIDSLVSMSALPLYVAALTGLVVLLFASTLGAGMLVNFLLQDPLGIEATGSAYLLVLLLFVASLILTVQGLVGLYVSHIYSEAQNRPLYIIDEQASR